jgi:uncharacterized Zn-binding protein involved in type VI secretion
MKKPVCLGDPTSHGGEIITASSTYSFNDRKAALVNDLVSCPRFYDEARTQPHGINAIIEGDEAFTDEGRQLVVGGCRAHCGCIVIAQEPGVTIE